MEKEKLYACWLCCAPGIGSRTIGKLYELCPDMEGIYRAGEKLWRRALNARQLEQLRVYAETTNPQAFYEGLASKGIRFVVISEAEYPRKLREIPDPPYGLFVKGNLPDQELLSVAVVGAREGSEYGAFVAAGIGRTLGENGVQVISGMARGIDGICQKAALEAGGLSFGVLGCGVDVCYPRSNRELYEKLCAQGGVLSAYAPGTEASPRHFPPRNRIVSGLADALVVVEARAKSGTLITVDMALEQGRDVYVVPGRVTDRLSDGCNRLIKQGAGVFLSPEDFLRELWESRKRKMGIGAGRENCGDKADGKEMKDSKSMSDSKEMKDSKSMSDGKEIKGGKSMSDGKGMAAVRGMADGKSMSDGGKRRETGIDLLPPEYGIVYAALDFMPLSLEQIQSAISEPCGEQKLMGILMRLCVERLAVQVSPGYFALRGV
ncbi:MAG: DNA-processing protein DprA [Muribaculum sp.]|nr:DNA-processing protein DprA [Muribaculum sp.]